MKEKRTVRFIAEAFAASAALILASCSGGGGGGAPGGSGQGTAQNVTSVTTMIAATSTLHDYVNTNGEIECVRSVDCFPDIGGKVAHVYVSLGDYVRRGAALVEVDPNEAGSYYRNSVVTAPIAGTVTATPLEVGTTVTTQSAVTTIGDVTNLQIRARVAERYVSNLEAGLKAEITLEAYPDETFAATVSRVSPVLDATSRTKEIILRFDDSDSRVNAGMFAKVKLYTEDYSGAVTLPSAAVVDNGDLHYAYVLSSDGTMALQREVRTGNTVDNVVQILSGISEGERVIVQGVTALSDKSPVRDITNNTAAVNAETN